MTDKRRPLIARDPPTADELDEVDRLSVMVGTELHTARQLAERWRNAGIVSGAVVLAGGLIAGPGALDGIARLPRLFILSLLVVASIAGIVSVATAIRASLGWPKLIDNSSPLALKRWEYKEATFALSLIRCSMVTTLIVAVAALAAVGLAFGTERSSGYVIVTSVKGSTICATSVVFGNGGQTAIAEVNGSHLVLRTKDIGSLSRSPTC